MLVLTILICIALMHTASALDPDDPDYWTDMGSESLHKGEAYDVGDYTVRFVDHVPETDQVYLSLLRGGELLNRSCLNASCVNVTYHPELDDSVCDLWNWEDEVIIAISNETEDYPESETPTQWDDPLIYLDFYERAKPEISLEIETNCETYTPRDSEIRVTVEIENKGDAKLKNIRVEIDPGDLQAVGDLTSHFGDLQEEGEGAFLFSWDDRDGILRFLQDDIDPGLDWAKDQIVERPDDDTIKVESGEKYVRIEISTDGDTASLNINDGVDHTTPTLEVEGEGSNRKVYEPSEESEESEESIYATLRVPQSIDDTEGQPYTITANVTGFDEEGVMYTESASTEILVLPRFDLKLKKTVNDHISMDDTVWVRIEVENTGIRDLEVRLNDTIPPGFRLCGNETPGWVFNITPSTSSQFSYHLKPERPGIFEIPAATAEFVMGGKNISVWSNAAEITVDGVCITVNKTAEPDRISEGGTVTVRLSVRNTGNMDATINLTDILPPGAELVSGDPTIQAVLAANQTNETAYVMSIATPGIMTLGSPMMSLSGSGYCYTTPTRVPVIEVIGSVEEPSVMSTPASTKEDPLVARTSPRMVDVSFSETMLAICMFAGVFLIGRFMR